MKVLVACEESQTVCKAFRERGHEAYSCDIIEPSGEHPEWHIQGDAVKVLEGGVHNHNGRDKPLYWQVGYPNRTSSMHLPEQCRSETSV